MIQEFLDRYFSIKKGRVININVEYSGITVNGRFYEKPTQKDKEGVKIKRKVIIVCLLIIIVGIIIYVLNDSNYNSHVEKAKEMAAISNYEGAYKEINFLSPRSKDKDIFDEIAIINYSSMYLNLFELDRDGIGDNGPDMKKALDDLILGYKKCTAYEKRARELKIDDKVTEYKKSYLDCLQEYYNLTEDKVKEICSLADDDYNRKIEEAVLEGTKVLNKEKKNR